MMICPSCGEKAISFSDWIRARNAFSTRCANCGVHLKADLSVYLNFIITILVALSLLPYADNALAYFGFPNELSKFKIVVLLPAIFIGGAMGWWFGGYKIKKST